jgi:hypothetical protein
MAVTLTRDIGQSYSWRRCTATPYSPKVTHPGIDRTTASEQRLEKPAENKKRQKGFFSSLRNERTKDASCGVFLFDTITKEFFPSRKDW